jgi:hypothetical protein
MSTIGINTIGFMLAAKSGTEKASAHEEGKASFLILRENQYAKSETGMSLSNSLPLSPAYLV